MINFGVFHVEHPFIFTIMYKKRNQIKINNGYSQNFSHKRSSTIVGGAYTIPQIMEYVAKNGTPPAMSAYQFGDEKLIDINQPAPQQPRDLTDLQMMKNSYQKMVKEREEKEKEAKEKEAQPAPAPQLNVEPQPTPTPCA